MQQQLKIQPLRTNRFAQGVWIASTLLLVLTLTTAYESLTGTPDFSSMSDAEKVRTVLPIALLTNGWFFLIGALIAFTIAKKLNWSYLILIIPAAVFQAKLTIAALPFLDSLPQ